MEEQVEKMNLITPVDEKAENPVDEEAENPVDEEAENPVDEEAENPVDEEAENPVDKVFGIPDLLEKILNFVIFEKKYQPGMEEIGLLLNKKNVKSTRLVQKSWLVAVSNVPRLCKNLHIPFHYLVVKPVEHAHDENPAVARDWKEYGRKTNQSQDDKFKKTLESFISTMPGKDSTVRVFMLPSHVTFHATFFASVNHQVILDLLNNCSSGLMSLKLEFPSNVLGVPKSFPQKIPLPSLKNLTVKFTDMKCTRIKEKKLLGTKREHLQMKFVQCILNGAEKLMAMEFGGDYSYSGENPAYIPSSSRHLKLPQCLQILHINLRSCPMSSSDLRNLMSQNELTKLHTFRVTAFEHRSKQIFADYIEPGLLFKILTPFQWSLERLVLFGSSSTSCTYRLPQLNNLKSLYVDQVWVMEPMGTDSADVALRRLDKLLPNVQKLNLKMTNSELMKWTKHSEIYESVKSLALELLPVPNDHDEGMIVPISLSKALVETVHSSFPNLTELTTSVRGSEMEGLRCIFREMTQLKKLFIFVQEWDDTSGRPLNLIYWDALFLGCTVEIADMLRKNGQQKQGEEMLKALQQKDHKGDFPSIRNLKNLEQLCLNNYRNVGQMEGDWGFSDLEFPEWNLYDSSFHRAFFQMEKLTSMQMHANAKVSPSVFEEWRRLKGTDLEVDRGLYDVQRMGYADYRNGKYTYY